MIKFKNFKELSDDTLDKILSFGITSKTVIKYYKRCVKELEGIMNTHNTVFDKELAFMWLNQVKGNTKNLNRSKYVSLSCYRRTILLLYDNFNNKLTHWKIYYKKYSEKPKSEKYLKIIEEYIEYLKACNYQKNTICFKARCAKNLLIYLEKIKIYNFKECTHQILSNYFLSEHFQNRKPAGINAEILRARHFICYLEKYGYTKSQTLHYALPTFKIQEKHIVTILDANIEKSLLKNFPKFPSNLRNKAVYLLALRCGLRACDIINLKFENIDFEKKVIRIVQKKTGVPLTLPIDNETLNAIIDYVLKERRKTDIDNVFITSKAPIKKLETRGAFCTKSRINALSIDNKPPQFGIHIMRRTYASKLLRNGIELPVISSALGQEDKNRVHQYLSTDEEKMKLCALEIDDFPYKGGAFK